MNKIKIKILMIDCYKCKNCTLPFNIVWNCKIREQKIMKELYDSDFYEITWDKKCV